MRGNTCKGSPCPVPPMLRPQYRWKPPKLTPITTATDSVILKFISRVTAADEGAVGVDTGLHTGVLSCTLVHICGKQKHITDHSHNKTSTLTRQNKRTGNKVCCHGRRYLLVPRISISDLSDREVRPQKCLLKYRGSIHMALWAHKVGRMKIACIHIIYMCTHVHIYIS